MSKLIIFTDGASKGNPGPASCGIVIQNEKRETILETSKYLGLKTNNQAEYEALILALQKAKGIFKSHHSKNKNVECYLDSELVVKHLNHQYKIKDEVLQPLFIKVWNLTLDFDKVEFAYIPRKKNRDADRLANREFGSLDL